MNLKQHFGKSSLWMSIAASGSSLVSFMIFVLLSRLLSPEDIGLIGFAIILIELGKILVTAGLPQAIIRESDWDETRANTSFYLSVFFSLGVSLAAYTLAAPIVAELYDPRMHTILQVLSIIYLLEGIKIVHEAKIRREFLFRSLAIRTLLSGLISGIVAVVMAFNGFGVWSLVWQQIINQVLITVLTLNTVRWWPTLNFSIPEAKKLLGFSTPLTIAQLINNLASKAYELLVGVLIGPAALGFFRVGGRALYIVQDIVIKPFEKTFLPALAQMNSQEQRAAGTLRLIRLTAYFCFPIFFGAAAIGPEFITLAFTDKWTESGHVMTLLALGIPPLVVGYQVNTALTASGHSGLVMFLAVLALVLNLALGVLLVSYGILAAATGFALRTYISCAVEMILFKRIFAIDVICQVRNVAPSFCAAVIMFGVLLLLKSYLSDDIHLAIRLLFIAGAGAVIYTTLMSCIFRGETRFFLAESSSLAPAKAKPAINKLQRFLRLA